MEEDNLIEGETSKIVFTWAKRNSYFLILVFAVLGCVMYRITYEYFENSNLPKNFSNYYNNFIGVLKNFIGKIWLKTNMKGDAIIVNDQSDINFLDKLVEDIDVLDIDILHI